MEILHMIFIAPFLDMVALPDLFFQGLWDGFVGGNSLCTTCFRVCFNF